MEPGYYALTALSIVVIAESVYRGIQSLKYRLSTTEFDEDCKRNGGLSKILKDEDKNIKF